MDKIILTDLRIDTVIGIWDWEKRNPQTISIDLEMETDTKTASQSDSIEDALDYKAVSKRVQQFIQESQFNLIETVAENVAKIILEEFDVLWLQLRISKPFAIRDSRDISICIERTKDG